MSMEPQKAQPVPLIDWLYCKDILIALGFSTHEIEQALKKVKYTVRDLTDETKFEHGEPTHFKVRELVQDWHMASITRHMNRAGHAWTATCQARQQTWRVPGQYQSLREEKLMLALLQARFPWFRKFKWWFYRTEYKAEDCYIYLKMRRLPDTSINLKDMLARDAKAIEEKIRNDIAESERLNTGKSDGIDRHLRKRRAVLRSVVFRRFLKLLAKGRK